LRERGYRIARFVNDEVYRNLKGVLETILAASERRTTL
jgi:very-short-patch-repair endonuclease